MKLLQLFQRISNPGRLARRLASAAMNPAVSADQLRTIIAEALAQYSRRPAQVGLGYSLGLACERLAGLLPWDDRTPWLQRAAEFYEEVLQQLEDPSASGAEVIQGLAAEPLPPSLAGSEGARLLVSLRLGTLLTVEYRIRDPARAISLLEPLLAILPPEHPVWYTLGEAYVLLGRFDDAERVWSAALRASPGDRTLQAVLRNLPVDRLHHAVKREDWLAVLFEANRIPEGAMPSSELWTLQGDAYLALGDVEQARQCWQAALATDRHAIGVRRRLRKVEREPADRVLQALKMTRPARGKPKLV